MYASTMENLVAQYLRDYGTPLPAWTTTHVVDRGRVDYLHPPQDYFPIRMPAQSEPPATYGSKAEIEREIDRKHREIMRWRK